MKFILLTLLTFTLLFADSQTKSIKQFYLSSYNFEQMGNYSEALKVLSPLYNKYPEGYTLNLRFGWLFFLDKKYNDAKKHYEKASLTNPYALDPRLGIIRVYLATASYSDAEQVAYELLKIDYYNYYANLYVIRALNTQKKYAIATKITQKMLALYPTDILFLEQLAIIYKATDSTYLEKIYADILILDPNNVFVNSATVNP